MKYSKFLFASVVLSSLLVASCRTNILPTKKDPVISVFVNGTITTSTDIGSFDYLNVPALSYEVKADSTLLSDYKYLSNTNDLGHRVPNEVGSYKYIVTVKGDDKYNDASRTINFSLTKNKLTPTINTFVSINGETAVSTDSLTSISVTTDDTYSFAYNVTSGISSDYHFTSNTTNYGKTSPTEPGDYKYIVETVETDDYVATSKTVNFTIEAKVIPPITQTADINIFAINDFHGQIEPQSGRAGLVKTYSYLKNEKNNNPDTLLLDQGDTFQGSIYSNYNRGALLTDVTNYCQFDARTIGNHDFDWGTEALKKCAEMSYENYRTPTLGANLYDYDFDTKIAGNTFRSDLGVTKVTTRTLSNGIKVGIVGVIGMDQITSISTTMSKDFVFLNHVNIIKEQAEILRNDVKCDVVICSVHAPTSEVTGCDLADYVDLVLCGHSHQIEEEVEDDLYFLQFDSYSKHIGNVTLTYDFAKHDVIKTKVVTLDSYDLSTAKDDPTIVNLLNTYKEQCDIEASEVLVSKVNGNFYSSGELPRVMANAIYDKAVSEGYTIDLAMLNNARASLYSSDAPWKYKHIYQAFPFDNLIYIADVKGSELIKEIVNYTNYFYRSDTFTDTSFDSNRTYRIACIDFLLFHTGLRTYGTNPYYRQYDYFNINAGNYVGVLSKNYRLILKDWLVEKGYSTGTKTLSYSDFSTYNSHFRPFN